MFVLVQTTLIVLSIPFTEWLLLLWNIYLESCPGWFMVLEELAVNTNKTIAIYFLSIIIKKKIEPNEAC